MEMRMNMLSERDEDVVPWGDEFKVGSEFQRKHQTDAKRAFTPSPHCICASAGTNLSYRPVKSFFQLSSSFLRDNIFNTRRQELKFRLRCLIRLLIFLIFTSSKPSFDPNQAVDIHTKITIIFVQRIIPLLSSHVIKMSQKDVQRERLHL